MSSAANTILLLMILSTCGFIKPMDHNRNSVTDSFTLFSGTDSSQPSSFSIEDWRRQDRWFKAIRLLLDTGHGIVDGLLGPAVPLKAIYIDHRSYRNISFGKAFVSVMPPYGRSPSWPYVVGFVTASLGMCLALIRCSVPGGWRWLGDIGAVYYLMYMVFILVSIFFYAADNPTIK